MADKEYVACAMTLEACCNFRDYSGLGSLRRFPATNTLGRIGKELIGDHLELGGRKKTRRASVIFMHSRFDFEFDPQGVSNWLGRLDCLHLVAGDDPCCRCELPKVGCQSINALSANVVQRPKRNWYIRINSHLRVGQVPGGPCRSEMICILTCPPLAPSI